MERAAAGDAGGGPRDGLGPAAGRSLDSPATATARPSGSAGLIQSGVPSGCTDDPRASLAPARVEVCGVEFDNVTMDEAIARIDALARSGKPSTVVTPNLDHVVRASRDPEYAAIVRTADLVVADGQPIVWASRLLGRPLKARVAGSDLFPRLCAHAAEAGLRVFFLGGAPPEPPSPSVPPSLDPSIPSDPSCLRASVPPCLPPPVPSDPSCLRASVPPCLPPTRPGAAEAARDVLVARHPRLQVVGVLCPEYGFERDAAAVERIVCEIRAARPDMVFVGLGSPKQEQFIARHGPRYGAAVSIGVGISFSFVAGHVVRAPRWMQRLGLEWLHRLVQEPGRLWRRYLVTSWGFLPLVVRGMWGRVRGVGSSAGAGGAEG